MASGSLEDPAKFLEITENGLTPEPEKMCAKAIYNPLTPQRLETIDISGIKGRSRTCESCMNNNLFPSCPTPLRQVLQDLTKFMDSLHNKMLQVVTMQGKLEIEAGGSHNVVTQEYHSYNIIVLQIPFRQPSLSWPGCYTYSSLFALRLIKDLEQVTKSLTIVFKNAAELKSELVLKNDDGTNASDELPSVSINEQWLFGSQESKEWWCKFWL